MRARGCAWISAIPVIVLTMLVAVVGAGALIVPAYVMLPLNKRHCETRRNALHMQDFAVCGFFA